MNKISKQNIKANRNKQANVIIDLSRCVPLSKHYIKGNLYKPLYRFLHDSWFHLYQKSCVGKIRYFYIVEVVEIKVTFVKEVFLMVLN